MNLLYPLLLGKAWLEKAWAPTRMDAPDTLLLPRSEEDEVPTVPVPLAAPPERGAPRA
jgi:hypothetical protein